MVLEVARLGGVVLEDKKQLVTDEGQYLKGYRYNILLLEVARLGFEPRSPGSKPDMMDPYTIGL